MVVERGISEISFNRKKNPFLDKSFQDFIYSSYVSKQFKELSENEKIYNFTSSEVGLFLEHIGTKGKIPLLIYSYSQEDRLARISLDELNIGFGSLEKLCEKLNKIK